MSSQAASAPTEPIRPTVDNQLYPNVSSGSKRGADEVVNASGPPVSLEPGFAEVAGEEERAQGRTSGGEEAAGSARRKLKSESADEVTADPEGAGSQDVRGGAPRAEDI